VTLFVKSSTFKCADACIFYCDTATCIAWFYILLKRTSSAAILRVTQPCLSNLFHIYGVLGVVSLWWSHGQWKSFESRNGDCIMTVEHTKDGIWRYTCTTCCQRPFEWFDISLLNVATTVVLTTSRAALTCSAIWFADIITCKTYYALKAHTMGQWKLSDIKWRCKTKWSQWTWGTKETS